MGSILKTIHYCSVSKGAQILYAYNGGDHEIENLALLCLERTPPYHKWYFQTMAKKIFGFLMEDVYVYFIIAHESLGKAGAHRFLEHLRDESRTVEKKGMSRSRPTLNSLCLQEQLVPVIRRLINSLENVSGSGGDWPMEQDQADLSPPCNSSDGPVEAGASTKAPLLGKPGKHEKKKMKDHAIPVRDSELEEHRKSTERGIKAVNSGSLDSTNRGASSVSPVSLQKDITLTRTRSSSQNIRKKWCRQVRIILIIDAVVCLVLFAIWLFICHGVECIQ